MLPGIDIVNIEPITSHSGSAGDSGQEPRSCSSEGQVSPTSVLPTCKQRTAVLPNRLCNSWLDGLVRPEINAFRMFLFSFRICGWIGLVLAIVLTMFCVARLSLSVFVMGDVVVTAAATFFGLVMFTKVVTGEERLVCYHHQIAVIVVTTILLWLLRQPVLPYLDVTILGVGMFLACGRVGCFMVGCCHGKPHHWGVRYMKEHAAAGFTPYYVGVRLFPIQLVESLWVFHIVTVGSVLVLSGSPPGEALTWYVMVYGVGRFCFEFARGDAERPYLLGFSQAQWASLLLMTGVGWAELAGVLQFHLWHAGVTLCLALSMIAIALARRAQAKGKHQLLHPHHVREVAEALGLICRDSNCSASASAMYSSSSVPVACTSLGFQISSGRIPCAQANINHYALSCRHRPMSHRAARILADLIIQLKHLSGPGQLVMGSQNVFHLLVCPLNPRSQP